MIEVNFMTMMYHVSYKLIQKKIVWDYSSHKLKIVFFCLENKLSLTVFLMD